MDKLNKNFVILSLVLVAMVLRFAAVLPNFSPVVAMSLLGASLLSRKSLALILPLVFLYATDFVLNNFMLRSFFPDVEGIVWYSPYMFWSGIAYILIVCIGFFALRNRVKVLPVIATTLLSSIVFYLFTNIGSWLSPTSIYPADFTGLLLALEAGIPFFRTSLISDLLFSGALFGAYFWITSFSTNKSKVTA